MQKRTKLARGVTELINKFNLKKGLDVQLMTEKTIFDRSQHNLGMRHESVQYVEIDENNDQQRIDNFLLSTLKGVPRSRIYRIIRKGEVRVNKKRCKVIQRLVIGDIVRIPPIRVSTEKITEFIPLGFFVSIYSANTAEPQESPIICNSLKSSAFRKESISSTNLGNCHNNVSVGLSEKPDPSWS